MADIFIQMGDELLDVDADTSIGFEFQNHYLDFSRDSGVRTYDLDVPSTRKNDRLFSFHELANMPGLRRSVSATVGVGGILLYGRMYVDEWSGGRYSLLFVTGVDEDFSRIPDGGLFNDSLIYDKSQIRHGGPIPNFGLYDYENPTTQGIQYLYPTANLGYIIDTISANLGYSVIYLSGNHLQNAHSFGLVLDKMDVKQTIAINARGHASLSDSPTNPWTVTVQPGFSLADAGLMVSQKTYRRGDFDVEFQAQVFKALRDVSVTVPGGQTVIIAQGDGNHILGSGTPVEIAAEGHTFDLEAGDWFTFGRPSEMHQAPFTANRWNWNLLENPRAFCVDINVNFSTTREVSQFPSVGDIVNLGQNLPELSLTDYLNNFCLLTCQIWRFNETTRKIEVFPLDDAIRNSWETATMEGLRMSSVDSVKKYIDGWARNNYVRCKSADYVNESSRFVRNYEQFNDIPEDARDIGTVAWNEGNYDNDPNTGEPIVFLDDVVLEQGGGVSGKGRLSIIVENSPAQRARHVEVLNREGIGEAFRGFVHRSSSVKVSLILRGLEFLNLSGTDGRVITWGGKRWIIREANWSNGVASVTLLSL